MRSPLLHYGGYRVTRISDKPTKAEHAHRDSPEHHEQVALFARLDFAGHWYPLLRTAYAIPNAAKRSYWLARYLQDEGLRAGVPDICLPVPRHEYGALYIELKAGDNDTTPDQDDWQERLIAAGNLSLVCWGWEQAWAQVVWYMDIPPEHATDLIDLALIRQEVREAVESEG